MGYDNECVLNIQSLPGEYFCPVCRTLAYPNEALQSQCTHLYCKPCLAYVVATTHACPYDGYLVTEADSKPLVEYNKELAETIGKVAVHCLYHRSGCQWQGTLAESTAHCAACSYGNSAVVCNRCGTQIIHRQVQEHAQICPGVQPQGQVVENSQAQAGTIANQAISQDPSSAVSVAPASITATATAAATPASAMMTASVAPTSSTPASASAVPGQAQGQGAAAVYPQASAQAPTAEQWYQQQQQQQQYQQYYQQYPGYDPYQQQYQQYAQYQQQVYPQYAQPQMQAAPQQVIPGQQQQQPYMQQPQPGQPQAPQVQPQVQPMPQPQAQAQAQAQPMQQPQPQAQPMPQAPPQPQTHPQPQHQPQLPQMQAQQPLVPQQAHPHARPQTHLPPHGHPAGQPYPQQQPHVSQAHPPQLQGPPQHHQTVPPQAHPQQQMPQGPPQHQQPVPPQQPSQQMPHPQSYPQHQPRPQHPLPQPQHQHQQVPMQMPPQQQLHTHPQPTLQTQQVQPSAHPVSGYQSYPQPIPGPPQQHPMQMQPQPQGIPQQQQFPPQQPPQTLPPPPQMPMPVHQQSTMPHPQGPHPAPQQGQHVAHQPGQQVYQQAGMQPHGQHGFPQQHAQVPSHIGQPLQQGPTPPQHQVHPQQSLRPHGQTFMQQPSHGNTHQHGLPPQQAQARPMTVNHGMLQQSIPQSPGAGSKPMLPGMSQQSPNQNYMGRPNPRGPTDSELQSRPLQQYSGSQGGVVSASPPTPAQGVSNADKTSQLQTSEGELAFKNDEGTKPGEKISQHVSDSKPNGDDEVKCSEDAKLEDGQAENDNKDVSKTHQGNVDGLPAKQLKGEEGTNTSGEITKNNVKGEIENQGSEGRLDEKAGAVFKGRGSHLVPELHTQPGPDKSVQREPLRPNLDRNQGFVSDGQIAGAAVNNMPHQQIQVPGSLDRSRLQQPPDHQNVFPAQARGYPQPGYNDRNPSQFPQQYRVSDDRQGIPPGAQQQIPFGQPPHMPDPTMITQMPPAPDRMFSQPMHQSSQERRFPEPSSHQMHVHGQTMPPGQVRPPGHSGNESFPNPDSMPPAHDARWPPPHMGGGASSHHGFPQKGFENQGMAHPGQAPSHLPPGARTALGDHLTRPTMGVQPLGPLGTPNRIGGHPFIPDDKMSKPPGKNAMEVEAHKRPGFYDGRQPEPHRPMPTEHTPYVEPNAMKMNGRSNTIPAGGMHDSVFSRGLPEDRFRHLPDDRFNPLPEHGFKAAHDEQFRTSTLDPSRHIVNRREFEEDLKQFPRPGHLDGEGPSRFDGYLSSSRPLDKMQLQSGGINTLTSRPLSGAPFPPGVGGPDVHMDIGDRERPVAMHEHMGKRHDGTFPPPDRVNPVHEFGRHRADGLPPLRSPGHFSRDVPDGMPSQMRGLDGGLGPRNHSVPSNLRGSEMGGPQNMPSFFRGGGFSGFRSHLDISDSGGPGNLPPHLRMGDPGFNGRFGSGSRETDIDSFEQSRKRKIGGTVRCLICKVDCETVEGLELHSQRREHQQKAMDMVLSIKKENAKKHRSSEGVTPFEGANKSRKGNFEKRATKH